MNISVSEASKKWGVSRTTIYKKIDDGELSRNSDKKIDIAEMLRVFGEPQFNEQLKNVLNAPANSVQKTPMNTGSEQLETLQLEHRLELAQLKNEHLEQQVKDQKNLIEDYQNQIKQLNKSLAQATASINEFAQTRLLEVKQEREPSTAEESTTLNSNPEQIHRFRSEKKSKIKSIVNILMGTQ